MDKQKILIVGHTTYTMSAFIRFLIDGPYEVFTAPDGREGLEILRREQIDLVIAEMYIEDVDGIHFVKCISTEKIQIDILLRARSEFPDLGEEIRKTSISVFPIIRDTFLVKVKTLVPSYDLWKTKLESFQNLQIVRLQAVQKMFGQDLSGSIAGGQNRKGKIFARRNAIAHF